MPNLADPAAPDVGQAAAEMPIEHYYPEGFQEVGDLGRGLKVVSEAVEHLEDAHNALLDGRLFESDDLTMRAGRCALDAFRYATIGDGWCSLLVAIHSAVSNRVEPLSAQQVELLTASLRKLRNQPQLSHDAALDVIEKLQDRGLEVLPNGFPTVDAAE